jgi:sedoheptulokinase
LGSVGSPDAILVNVGTGSQVSVLVDRDTTSTSAEIRPFVGLARLGVGSSLCGGDAYAVLKRFFEATATALGTSFEDPYAVMNRLASLALGSAEPLVVDTRFRGSRAHPLQRGSVSAISVANLTPENLCLGTLKGIVEELYSLYSSLPASQNPRRFLVGSGNGIRKNPVLRTLFAERFGLPLQVPLYDEEAAYGAALFSLHAAGIFPSVFDAQKLIRYQDS